ncbi:uncharacterized protein LY79DRAFT_520357 [Colletotrichum navitas]|uniref:Rhodopsin domain-containing protein n=1 Tax=Colletotrichum navitas TaxID=681940 RepID=A0AAD8PTR9_9PEZI|nr:uncharacterized protein LY79DRAFT_520357 [Colletotrichum navitas]KAK1580570.1 hypothetical protein LY79DRAFT_520357 [Colletotrichum navitas]
MSAAANPNAPLVGAAQSVDLRTLAVIIWTCFSVATLFAALRLSVRWRQNRHFLADDYCIICAWMSLVTMTSLQTRQLDALYYTTYLDAGRIPVTAETAAKTEDLARWQFPIIKLFCTVLWFVKASFMAVFYRLVKPFPVRRSLWYCVAVFTILAYIGCWVISALTCSRPFDYFKAGKCNNPHEVWMKTFHVFYATSVDVVSDMMIMALPLTILPSLQIDRKKKIGLAFAFSLASIIICVAIVRMNQSIKDQNVDYVGLAIWSAVETATAIVVGSLLPLKAFLTRGVTSYYSSASKKNTQRYGIHQTHPGATSTYVPDMTSRSVAVTQSIPLDDLHRSRQMNGRIYVQRTYETHASRDDSSRGDDDEVAIIKSQGKGWEA